MSEKNLNVRIIHKHDIEANWLKATNFAPKQGELIVYDKDSNYAYERFKIGDGVTNVNSLPFCGEAANIETPSSGTTYKGKWVKFATVSLPSAWDVYSGIFNFVKAEGSYGAEGILSYYFRNDSSMATTDISLSWIALNNANWAGSVAAVRIDNGKFELYYKPVKDYEAVFIANINTYDLSYLTFNIGEYIDTITAEETSSVCSYAQSAKSAAMLQTYKPGSTVETYGEQYPLLAQWEDENTLKLLSEDSVVKVDYAETAGNVPTDDEIINLADQRVKANKPRTTTITLLSSNWVAESNLWSQVVDVQDITADSKVD